ncbi:hypothetical protein T4A_2540, partial [Trichinella pseudospiralis]
LTRPSLFGNGPVLTSAFPFRSISRFPDGIAITEQQAMGIHFIKQSETRIDDDINTRTLLATCQPLMSTTTTVLLLRSSCLIFHTFVDVDSWFCLR